MAAPPPWSAGTQRRRSRDEEDDDDEMGGLRKLAKSRGKGGKKDKEELIEDMVKLLGKLILTNSMQIREVCGVVYNTYELDLKLDIMTAMKEANKKYHENTKDNPTHELGPPYLHTWTALIKTLAEETKLQQASRKAMVHYWNSKVTKVPPMQLADEVKYCRIRENKGDGKKAATKGRLQFALSHDSQHTDMDGKTLAMALDEALLTLGATRKVGTAPRGPLEREISKLLDKM